MAPFLVLALLAIVLVGGIGGVYYFAEYRPRHYLEEWGWEMGYPDTLVRNYSFVDGERAHINLEQGCSPRYRNCDPSPAKDISNWLGRGIGNMTEKEAAECFQNGCQRVFYREGHKAVVTFHHISSSWNFKVEVDLYW